MNQSHALERASFWLLATLLFVLPIVEVPKTVAAWLFIIVSWWSASSRNAGRRPDAFGWALLGVVTASLASTAINWPFPNKAKGLYDTAVYAVVGWGVYRRGWTDQQARWLAWAAVSGVVVGVAWSAADVVRGSAAVLRLHSVGLYPSSSIYLGVVLMITVALAATHTRWRWWGWTILSGAFFAALLLMSSRGGILASVLAVGMWLLLIRPARIWVAAVAVAVVSVAVWPNLLQSQPAFQKMAALVATRHLSDSDMLRVTMWRIGAAQVVRGGSPWFGVGPRNFSSLDPSRLGVERPAATAGVPVIHAHNLFLTKAAEEGLVGLMAMLALFGVVAHRLTRDWLAGRALDWRWGAAWGALLIPVIGGSFNTPWYQEHALLAMIWFGLYLGSRHAGAVRPYQSPGTGGTAPLNQNRASAGQLASPEATLL
ncbi:MAG: O-antigen ligase family protein [Nitrospirota bacterium]